MTAADQPLDAEIPRERGWGRVAFAVLLFLFFPVTPLMRILVPVDQTLLLLAPLLAVCALVGWWAGGRPTLAAGWTAVAGWVMWRLVASGTPMTALAAAWALGLAVVFGALVVWQRSEATARPFFPRALSATVLTGLLAVTAASLAPGGIARVQDVLATDVSQRTERSLAEWRQIRTQAAWQDLVADKPSVDSLHAQVDLQLQRAPATARVIAPAMLVLESLAALALAWALYHRVGRARLGPPLAALRAFRFNDQFVWGLIAGMVLVILPAFDAWSGVGANLLLFFGVLYALRGLGVLVWFLAPGRFVMALLIGFAVLFWNVLGVLALGLGLGDTWLDWRSRPKPKT